MFETIEGDDDKTRQAEAERKRSEFLDRALGHAALADQLGPEGNPRQAFFVARQARLEARIVVEDPGFAPAISRLGDDDRERLEATYSAGLQGHPGARESDFRPVDVPVEQMARAPGDRTPEALAASVENGDREFLARDAELPDSYVRERGRQKLADRERRPVVVEFEAAPAVGATEIDRDQKQNGKQQEQEGPGLAEGVGEIDAFAPVADAVKKPQQEKEPRRPPLHLVAADRVGERGQQQEDAGLRPASSLDRESRVYQHDQPGSDRSPTSGSWADQPGRRLPLGSYAQSRDQARGADDEDDRLLGLTGRAIDSKDRAAFTFLVGELRDRGEDTRQKFNALVASRTGDRFAGRQLILEEQHQKAVMERLGAGFSEIDRINKDLAEGRGNATGHRERLAELQRATKLDSKIAIEDERMSSKILGSEHRERVEQAYKQPIESGRDRRSDSDGVPLSVAALKPEHRSPAFNLAMARRQEDRFLADGHALPADYMQRREESGQQLSASAEQERQMRAKHSILTARDMKSAVDNLRDGKVPSVEIGYARAGIAEGHAFLSKSNSYDGAAYKSGQAAATRLAAAAVAEQVNASKQPPSQGQAVTQTTAIEASRETLPPPTATKAAMQEFRRELMLSR